MKKAGAAVGSPSVSDPFTTLGMEPAAVLDKALLDSQYTVRLQGCHPDAFPEKEEEANRLNQAYTILKNPVQRVQVLLMLKNLTVKDKSAPKAFLLSLMGVHEVLNGSTTMQEVEHIKSHIQTSLNNYLAGIDQAIAVRDRVVLQDLWMQLTYTHAMLRDANKKLDTM